MGAVQAACGYRHVCFVHFFGPSFEIGDADTQSLDLRGGTCTKRHKHTTSVQRAHPQEGSHPRQRVRNVAHTETPTSHIKSGKYRTTTLAGSCHSTGMVDDNTQVREGHDRIAKRLFAHADVVAEMLRRFLPQGLLPEFDTTTLRRFPEERVGSSLALRRADVAWEFALRDGTRVLLLIEAQSTPDAAMASRMALQCAML